MTDFYYLVVLPFSKLHRLAVESYETTTSTQRLLLEQNSRVQIETAGAAYTAVFNGIEIAGDDATFCPIDDHRIAFYSRTARQLRYPLPATWKRDEVTARTLTLQGPIACKIQIVANTLIVEASPKQPVILYENEHAIPEAGTDDATRAA
jgi:hypothetical protein